MSQKNYWLKNAIITVFQNSSNLILGFLNFYMLIRLLTPNDYGTWIIFVSIITIVELSKNGLTQEATIKYLSGANRADKKKITTATFVINVSISILLTILFLLLSPLAGQLWNSDVLPLMLNLYTATFIISGLQSEINCIEQANLQFKGTSLAPMVKQLLPFAYISYHYFFDLPADLTYLTVATILGVVAATIVSLLFTYKYISFTKFVDFAWIKKIFNFGKYSFAVWVSTMLAGSIDQMMLGSMLSKAASGVFNVTMRITNLTDIPINAMSTIVFPQSSKRHEADGDASVKYLYERSVGVILAVLMPCSLALFILADFVMLVVAGETYQDSVPLLRIILINSIFAPYVRQSGIVLAASGRARINFYLVTLSGVLVFLSNLVFIRYWGILGAAYASVFVNVVAFLITRSILKKFFNINVLNPWIYAVAFYPEFIKKFLKRKSNEPS
ncbi:flippase [Niabella insulamsoli]|uniref:flippase n=1 Tax=Niabella insulamsoli TaxID=3144874 RepID=UPI0031FE3D19